MSHPSNVRVTQHAASTQYIEGTLLASRRAIEQGVVDGMMTNQPDVKSSLRFGTRH
jgi:hypothetical protein